MGFETFNLNVFVLFSDFLFFFECKSAGTKTYVNAFERFVIAITGSLTSSADSWCYKKDDDDDED